MRILTVMTTPYGRNGITTVVKNFYNYINKKKYHMDFIFQNEPYENDKLFYKENNSEVYVVRRNPKRLGVYIDELSEIINKGNYDIIHVHGNSRTMAIELLVAKKCHVPVRIAHGHASYTKYPLMHKLLTPLFFSSLTYGIAVSEQSGEFLFGSHDYDVLENGIDVEKYIFNQNKREIIRKDLCLTDNEVVIGNIGRFSEEKNHKFLIEVFSEVLKINSNYRLLLVGDGLLRNQIEDYAKKLKINDKIIFTGTVENVNDMLLAMDIYVVTSLKEGLNITLIEAQASDLPCIASDAIPHEVNITDTIQFAILENQNFVDKILKIHSDNFMRNNCKMNSMVKKSNFNIKISSESLEKIYRRH